MTRYILFIIDYLFATILLNIGNIILRFVTRSESTLNERIS